MLALLFGAVNAVLVVRANINSVVVTLGVGSLAIGLGGWISQETSVSGLDFSLSNIALARVRGAADDLLVRRGSGARCSPTS